MRRLCDLRLRLSPSTAIPDLYFFLKKTANQMVESFHAPTRISTQIDDQVSMLACLADHIVDFARRKVEFWHFENQQLVAILRVAGAHEMILVFLVTNPVPPVARSQTQIGDAFLIPNLRCDINLALNPCRVLQPQSQGRLRAKDSKHILHLP